MAVSVDNWKAAANKLGWYWSSAHDGYINEGRRDQRPGWDSYKVAEDAEEACFWDGIETEDHAVRVAVEGVAS